MKKLLPHLQLLHHLLPWQGEGQTEAKRGRGPTLAPTSQTGPGGPVELEIGRVCACTCVLYLSGG